MEKLELNKIKKSLFDHFCNTSFDKIGFQFKSRA